VARHALRWTAVNAALTMSVDEAARLLGIGRGLAYEAVRNGEIPSIRLGRRVLIPRARLLELLGAEQSPEKREPGFDRAQGSRGDEHAECTAES
jgi:excisionase family DNA binding protein